VGKRRKSREIAMQMLFQSDLGRQNPEEVKRTFWQAREKIDPDTQGFAEDIFRVAVERQEEIDTYIVSASENWRLERMAAVDRNLLRAAIAEMLAYPATPLPIIINESLEVARMYSAPESIQFLNGILDAVARALPRTAKQLVPRP
jgi:N utilization substance protein B